MDFFYEYIIKVYALDDPDIEYLEILKKLEDDIKTASTLSEKEEIFDTFINNYTVIPAIWHSIIFERDSFEFVNIEKYFKESIPDLYFHISIFDKEFHFNQYYNLKNRILFSKCYEHSRNYGMGSEYFLSIPHSDLEDEYKNCDEYSNRPIPKEVIQKYKKAKGFADRLSAATNLSDEEWVQILFEWDDLRFAIQKIEYRLTKEIWNKNLWKAYINAMKIRNPKILLNIYFRYTRLFVSDLQMKNEYGCIRKGIIEIDEYANLQELEFYIFEEVQQKFQNFNFLDTFKHAEIQCFDFPDTFIHYILDNSRADLRLNIFKSCKSLFLLKSTPICHHLRISSTFKDSKYLLQYLQIRELKANEIKALSKLYITNRFDIKYLPIETLSKIIIPKISKCDARFICIFQQVISINEFEFLVDPSRIEKFFYDNGGITNSDGTVVNLRLLLERLSNAYSIGIQFNQKYELSPVILSYLKRNVKIESFWLMNFNALLNLEDYCNFILKNASPSAKFGLGFSDNITSKKVEAFNEAVNKFIVLNLSEKFSYQFEIGYFERYKAINLTKIVLPKIASF